MRFLAERHVTLRNSHMSVLRSLRFSTDELEWIPAGDCPMYDAKTSEVQVERAAMVPG